jgi:hypothetical protein
MEKRSKILILLWVVSIVVLLIIVFQKMNFDQKEEDVDNSVGMGAVILPVKINYTNLGEEFSKTEMVADLPKDSKILLKFYNFDLGERQWERFFMIQKGEVRETLNPGENADMVLLLHSKYLGELTNQNFCSITKQAKENGDMGIETTLSSTALAWKFKSVYEYKDCFGL